jgi:hypothetical protein
MQESAENLNNELETGLALFGAGALTQGEVPNLPGTFITPTGILFDATQEYSEDALLEFGKGVAAVSKFSKIVQGDYLREMLKRFPAGNVYDKACALFGGDRGTLKNTVSILNRVPVENRVEGVSFGHLEAVATLKDEKQKEVLEVVTAGKVDEKTGEHRILTREETREVVKLVSNSQSPISAAEAVIPVAPLLPPYTELVIKIRGMEEGESKKAYSDHIDVQFAYAKKMHTDPAFAAKQAEKERKDAFKEVTAGVAKENLSRFVTMLDAGDSIPLIRSAVAQFNKTLAETAELDTLLTEVKEEEREQFRTMKTEGKAFKDIKEAVKAHLTKAGELTKLNDLVSGIKEEDRAQFTDLYHNGTSLKDVKVKVKEYEATQMQATTHQKTINNLLKNVAEEDKQRFLDMDKEGKTVDEIKVAVNAHLKAIKDAKSKTETQNKARRKELQNQIKMQLEAANTLRKTENPSDIKNAEILESAVAKLQEELNLLEGAVITEEKPAETGTEKMVTPLLKPSQKNKNRK